MGLSCSVLVGGFFLEVLGLRVFYGGLIGNWLHHLIRLLPTSDASSKPLINRQ